MALPQHTFGETGANEGTLNFAIMAIAILFIIYITTKGELGTYLSFFSFTASSSPSSLSPDKKVGDTSGNFSPFGAFGNGLASLFPGIASWLGFGGTGVTQGGPGSGAAPGQNTTVGTHQ